ncbi:hypothetical protein LTR78_002779 [Recurvomyces mirabilis]|uniref:Prokaryotic-type class I peptide chain release factors domain-containing protein n=1 Tax=Recurvomyces mirabilis TaxID=574656 RepID=A0AAE1C3Y7_9PEZI|nr:hypothetical protein LTR78_002779 [Recurvomyces mirabilis]KAK5159487.1 hypothetical protein LTS14_002629 [Recurvomyces mirabilis]
MLRYVTLRSALTPGLRQACIRCYSNKRPGVDVDEEELVVARKWLANLNPDTIPRNICEISFSRSSGPGGQNVNKVSSKATLRLPTATLLPLIPSLLHTSILQSRYHAAKTSAFIIQADDSRKQGDNVTACFRRLHEVILEAGREAVPGETTVEQSQRVEVLKSKEKAGTRRMKEFQSKKKSARRGGGGRDE